MSFLQKVLKQLLLFLKLSSDLERIGDHAINIASRAQKIS